MGIHGARIFDLQIGLTAIDGGAVEIWTHDRRFVSLPGLEVLHPF
jgi:predicted nucleic acid-binding protein